jgi:hypothetical protein
MIKPVDYPDRLAPRILIGARVYELARLAARTARSFQRTCESTKMTPAETAAEMEAILERERDRRPLGDPASGITDSGGAD